MTIHLSGTPDHVHVSGDFNTTFPYPFENHTEFAGRIVSHSGKSLLVVIDKNPGGKTYNYLLTTSPEDEFPEGWQINYLGGGLTIVTGENDPAVVVSLSRQVVV